MKTNAILKIAIAIMFTFPTVASAQEHDALDDALALVGLHRDNLGWRPKGWWQRYPGDIPYKLRAFDDLFAEPIANVSYLRTLAASARKFLDPQRLASPGTRGDGALFCLVHALGVHPKLGTFRGYAANLTAPETPLGDAILAVHRAAGRPTKFVTFGTESPYPLFERDLAEKTAAIPEPLRPILGQLVLNVLDAQHWADLAFRNVDAADRIAICRRLNIGQEQVDALDYAPEFDDVARTLDEASLWYAAQKSVEALDDARLKLTAAMADDQPLPDFAFDWETPYGWIRLRGAGNDTVDGKNAWLIVDLGGNDRYTGPVAASTAERPLGLLLDLAGDDEYTSTGPAQGAGLCGVGVLVDAAGNDRYNAEHYAQGVGQFGLGACLDLAGDDAYFVKYSGQGCGYFGIGVLADAAGRDTYKLYCDGQGLGGVAGVGTLADYAGDDSYEAVRDATITGRPSYHSPDLNISVSNAQGCAMGRRGDGADGHSWAGGLGTLIDLAGNDTYVSGNWAMGTGYWFGAGYLYDGDGDDAYHGVCYTEGTGAHFCIGVLLDEAGNDRHLAEGNGDMSLAWGHDFVIAMLIDEAGNDAYAVKKNGMSYSINRSVTMLIDRAGDDTYTTKPDNRPGMAPYDEKYRDRSDLSTYFADATSLALFLDMGGADMYQGGGGADNSTWLDPDDSSNRTVRNYSIGVDTTADTLNLIPRPQ
jgi:hypothetical protein